MTLNIEAFREWIKECFEIEEEISESRVGLAYETILEKSIRPYFYYLQEWEKNHDGGGRESDAKPLGGTGAAEALARSVPEGQDAAVNPAPISVHVRGDTKPHKDRLKIEWRLRWDPKEKVWYGRIPEERHRDFLAAMTEMKLEVTE